MKVQGCQTPPPTCICAVHIYELPDGRRWVLRRVGKP